MPWTAGFDPTNMESYFRRFATKNLPAMRSYHDSTTARSSGGTVAGF